MAILRCTLRSTMMLNDVNFNIILPDKRLKPPKVLYLLHGYQQYFGSWLEQSSVARYASGKNLCIVMPDGGRSFYSDMAMTGENYYSFITKELPRFLKTQLAIDSTRENTAIAGLSMGGYGALKIGLNNPDCFSMIGAFSPACDIEWITGENPTLTKAICGDKQVKDSMHDLHYLIKNFNAEKPLKICHYCGTDDFMIDQNRAFRDLISPLNFDYSYNEEPGVHEWRLWDKWAEDFINQFMQ